MVRPVLNPLKLTVREAHLALGMYGEDPDNTQRRTQFAKDLEDMLTREKFTNKASFGKPQFIAILKILYTRDYLPQDVREGILGDSVPGTKLTARTIRLRSAVYRLIEKSLDRAKEMRDRGPVEISSRESSVERVAKEAKNKLALYSLMDYRNIDHIGVIPAFTPDLKDVKIYCWTIDPTEDSTKTFTIERKPASIHRPGYAEVVEISASKHCLSEVDDPYAHDSMGRLGYLHTLTLNGPPTIETLVKAWSTSFYRFKVWYLDDREEQDSERPENRFPRHFTGSRESTVVDDISNPAVDIPLRRWPGCLPGKELWYHWGDDDVVWGDATIQFRRLQAMDIWDDSMVRSWLNDTVLNPNQARRCIPTLRVILHREDNEPNSPIPLTAQERANLATRDTPCSKTLPFRSRAHFENFENPLLPEHITQEAPVERRAAKKRGVATRKGKGKA